jgi:predicted porin
MQTRLDSYGSRLLISGKEELDENTSVKFLLSTGFSMDTGTGTFCSRECQVQLLSKAGTLTVGRTLTFYDDVSLPWYFIEAAGNHNPVTVWANCGNGADEAGGCFDNYTPSTVRYDTPDLGGSRFSVSVSMPEGHAQELGGKIVTAGISYETAGWKFAYAHLAQTNMRDVDTQDSGDTISLTKGFRGFRYGLGYERLKYSSKAGDLRRRYVGMLLVYRAGPHAIFTNFGIAGTGYGTSPAGTRVNSVANLPHSGGVMGGIGYQYVFSPTTRTFVFFNQLRNRESGSYTFDSRLGSRVGRGGKISSLVIGWRQKF